MGTGIKFPLTRLELADIGGPGLVRFPATFDEYWELLEEAEYTADFYQNEIIAMSYETDLHSKLTTRMSFLLTSAFLFRTGLVIHNSNRPIYAESCEEDETGVFNPDGSVVSQPPVYFEYRPGMNAETTPVVLFEVLSKTTRAYDLGTKLPCYKRIPSLRYILYIEIDKPSITVYERQGPNRWTDTEYVQQGDVFSIDGQPIALKDVYLNLYF
jgi:Uma2 family endonuclease